MDSYKLKTLFKIQEYLFLSLKPLLSCLDTCSPETKNLLTKSIQLISSANLSLNRFRRATIAPHLKNDIRKQILSLPVRHNSFFGEDFNKASDSIIREQATLDKIIFKKPKYSHSYPNKYPYENSSEPSTSNAPKQFFRGKNLRGSKAPRGRGHRGRYPRRGSSYYQSQSNQPSYPSTSQPSQSQ